MSSPNRTTALMGLIAAGLCAAAAWYYPWPQASSDRPGSGSGLFAPFDSTRVWTIEIVQHDADRQLNEQWTLQRQGERWVVPARASFPAGNVARRTAIVGAVSQLADSKAILQRLTDRQEDHATYGVVDPLEVQQVPARGGVGTRVTLEDRNQQPLATVIVGRTPEGGGQQGRQAYIRVPGQPQVYLCEFPPEVLSTAFRDWVDSNLFELRTQARNDGELLREAVLQSPLANATPGWRATLAVDGGQLVVRKLELRDGEQWRSAVPDPAAGNALTAAVSLLAATPVDDARPVDPELARHLAEGQGRGPGALYESMGPLGFRPAGDEAGPVRLDSDGGQITVRADSGMLTTMYIGNVFTSAQTRSKLARCVFLHASAVPDRFPRPEPPAAGGTLTDEQQREYSRTLEAWQQSVDGLQTRVRAFNAQHSKWYYVIDESAVSLIMPVLPELAPAAPEPAGGTAPAAGEAASDEPPDGQ